MSTSETMPSGITILKMVKRNGIAGQYAYEVTVTFPDMDPDFVDMPFTNTFAGSVYGGPIVAVSPMGYQMFVSPTVTDHCGGILNTDWIRRFYS